MQDQDIISTLSEYLLEELLYDQDIELRPDTELLDSGLLDSMAAVQLVAHCEETFAMQFDPDDLTFENFASLAAVAALVTRAKTA